VIGRTTAAVAAALALLPGSAAAHAFRTGADAYAVFLQGVAVPLNDPWILLCLLPVGVMVGIWRKDGMPAVWPGLIGGLLLGFLLAPLLPEGLALVPLAFGLIASVLAAAALSYPRPAVFAFMTLAAAVGGWMALAGHGWGELPLTVYAGVFLGAHFAVVLPAAAVVATRRLIPAGWLMIAWRALASWLGAVAMMLAAFQLA
jgi:hypothetical protein